MVSGTILLLFLLPGQAVWPHTAAATTYYVSTTGDDDNTGTTKTAPWKSITKVNTVSSDFRPGDRVLFKRGDTWHETLRLSCTGNKAKPIIVGAYGNKDKPLPVFDGTCNSVISWQQVGPNLYKSTTPLWKQDPGLLIYDGVPYPATTTLKFTSDSPVNSIHPGAILLQVQGRYANFWVTSVNAAERKISGITFFRDPTYYWQSSTRVEVRQEKNGEEEKFYLTIGSPDGLQGDPKSLTKDGQWYWDAIQHSVYLYSKTDPSDHIIEIGQLKSGIKIIGQRYLRIKNISIRGFTETGIHLINCRNIVVKNLHVSAIGSNNAKVGILLQGSDHCNVTGNRVESVLVNGISLYIASYNRIIHNKILHAGAAGITLSRDDSSQKADGNLFKNNIIKHSNVFTYDSGGIYFFMAGAGNVIRGNRVRNGGSRELQSSGIMVDIGSLPVTITKNTVENNSMGGIVLTGTGHTVTKNRIRYNGFGYWQSAQIILFPVTGNVSDCTIHSNTVAAANGQKLFLVINALPHPDDIPNDIDRNTYQATDSETFCWTDGWTCSPWLDFATWRTRTGQDLHSTFRIKPIIQPHVTRQK